MCANIFIRKDDKRLLLKRSDKKQYAPGYIHPFGWKIDPNENPFEAALREIKEEVWISVKNMKLEAVITEIHPQENWLIFHFSADYHEGEVITTNEWEAVLLTEQEIVQSNLFPSVRLIIDTILHSEKWTVFTSVERHNGQATLKKIHHCL